MHAASTNLPALVEPDVKGSEAAGVKVPGELVIDTWTAGGWEGCSDLLLHHGPNRCELIGEETAIGDVARTDDPGWSLVDGGG